MPYKFNPFTGTFDDSTTGPQGATGTVSAAGSGTAAAPGIAFSADPNTGIYNPSADNLAISTGGTGRLFVGADGKVAVGNSAITVADGAMIGAASSTGARLKLCDSDLGVTATDGFELFVADGGDAYIWQRENNPLLIGTNGTERMRLTSAGLLGLGTSSPVAFLHVSGSGASSCRLTDTQSYNFGTSGPTLDLTGNDSSGANTLFARLKGSPNNGNADRGFLDILTRVDGVTTSTLQVGTGLAANVLIPNGRVGIGTSSPSQVLTAVGNIKIAGAQAGNIANLCLTRTDRSWTINNETDLRFRTGAGDTDSPATATVVFTGAGNVGIGTTSPGAPLEVVGSTNGDQLRINQGGQYYRIGREGGGGLLEFHGAQSGFNGYIFGGANGERARIDSSGNFGVGVTSPATASFGNVIRNKAPSGTGAAGIFTEGANSDTWFGIYSGTGTSDSAALVYPSTGSLRIATTTGVGVGGYSERLRIDSSGRLLVGTSSDSGGALLQVNGDRIRIGTAKTPASATATGTTGEIAWDANYIYVCTATNTWKRTAISTW